MRHPCSVLPWPSFEPTKAQKQAQRKRLLLACLGALCMHAVLGAWLSYALQKASSRLKPKPSLAIELQQFMEPNPAVAANEPDSSRIIAYKSQQAAQEHMREAPLGDLPTIEGDIADSQSIVEASLASSAAVSVEWLAPEAPTHRTAALPEEALMPGLTQPTIPECSQDSLVETLGEGLKVHTIHPDALDRNPEDPIVLGLSLDESLENPVIRAESPAISPPQRAEPRPRPRLSAKALQAPIVKSQTRVASLGVIAIDAQWSLFGAYQQQVLEAISLQWQLLASHLKSVERDKRSEVVVEFHLKPDGRIEGLKVLKTSASLAASLVCQDAIRSREPFGVWPEEMVKLFGQEKRVCIHFFYR